MSRKKMKKNPEYRPVSGFYRGIHKVFKHPVCGVSRLHIHGAENEPPAEAGACVVICNHLTAADPIYVGAALSHRQPHFMAKKELFKIPLLKQLIQALGAYPVNRGGADVGAIKNTIAMLQNGVSVGMFPQGHRYNGEDPRTTPIKSGAALVAVKAQVPVLPLFIKTKDHKAKFLRRKDIYIGKPIMPEEFHYDPEASGEFQRISELLFERVCALGDEAHD